MNFWNRFVHPYFESSHDGRERAIKNGNGTSPHCTVSQALSFVFFDRVVESYE